MQIDLLQIILHKTDIEIQAIFIFRKFLDGCGMDKVTIQIGIDSNAKMHSDFSEVINDIVENV